jgi:hypothetical protein
MRMKRKTGGSPGIIWNVQEVVGAPQLSKEISLAKASIL